MLGTTVAQERSERGTAGESLPGRFFAGKSVTCTCTYRKICHMYVHVTGKSVTYMCTCKK